MSKSKTEEKNSESYQFSDGLVVIVLATYNGERFLSEQLNSILDQTYLNWHIVVSDDGSSDQTQSMLGNFIERNPGKMTLVKHEGEGGACANFLYALDKALDLTKGEYFAFCDQDDYWEPNKLEVSVAKIRTIENGGKTPALVFSDAAVVDSELKITADSFFDYTGVDCMRTKLNELLVQNPISGAGMLFNRALGSIVSHSTYNESIWMHDQWVGLIAACFGSIAAINEPLFKYRQHESNAMGAIEMSWRLILEKARVAKQSLTRKQGQALYLLEAYLEEIPQNKKMVLYQFGFISEKVKLARIQTCIKNSFFMNGILRNIGLCIFI